MNGFAEFPETVVRHVEALRAALDDAGWAASIGRTRATYLHPDRTVVIKVPITALGMTHNGNEARAMREWRAGESIIPIANCRLVYADREVGVPLLVMDRVEPATFSQDMPDWCWMVDCQQVGYDRTGRLVAYDI